MKRALLIAGVLAAVVLLAVIGYFKNRPAHDAAWNAGYAYAKSHQSDYATWQRGGLGTVSWCTSKSFVLNKPGMYIDDWRGGCYAALGHTY